MTAYATPAEVAAGFRELDEDEQARAGQLLQEAALLIDTAAKDAGEDAKKVAAAVAATPPAPNIAPQ